jgi:hypothetical protein
MLFIIIILVNKIIILDNKFNLRNNFVLIYNILLYKNTISLFLSVKRLASSCFKFNLIKLVKTYIINILNKYIILYIFQNNIYRYLNFVLLNFKSEIPFFKQIDFSLDLLIKIIYIDTKKFNPLIFFIISYFINFFLDNTIYIYLSQFSFLIGTFIFLIFINNKFIEYSKLKSNFPLIYNIIKYCLFGILLLNLYLLIIMGQQILILAIKFFNNLILKTSILDKLKDFKLSLEYKRLKGSNKPNNPNNSEISFFWKKNKKEKNKIKELREKILIIQNNNNIKPIETSFSNKRNFKETICIEKIPVFSKIDQLKRVQDELKAYTDQENKFKKIVVNIKNKKETFFPEESVTLFNEYISVIKTLKNNLKSIEQNLKK